jgi:peptide/nickel transport system substrate-binding protein
MSPIDRSPIDAQGSSHIFEHEVSRRDLLKGTAALGVAGALSGSLGGFVDAASAAAAKPRYGGRLRLAMIGGGQAESFDPGKVGLSADAGAARAANLYDTLVFLKPDLTGYYLGLAESIEPDKKLTSWTIRLKRGITFHDGSPLTADDVIYTIRRAASDPSNGAYVFTKSFNAKGMKKLDTHTLRLPLTRPLAHLQAFLFPAGGMAIQKNGETNFKHPVGTGPFMFKSFNVGVSSLMVRNPNYWQTGKPYVDELEINSVMDANARFTALQTGVVDGCSFVPFPQARAMLAGQKATEGVHAVQGGLKLLVTEAPSHVYFTMRVDQPPFTDNRVRLAMRLIAKRQALVEEVNDGFGYVGNDIRFPHTQFYDNVLPQRHQDIAQAKYLLKKAGHEKLKVTLYASDWGPGMLDSATVFAQQASQAGVTIAINNTAGNNYLANDYLKVTFGQSFATPFPIPVMYSLQLVTGGIWNETHWDRPSYDRLIFAAQGEPNPAKARDLWFEAQSIIWHQGGDLIWGITPFVDGLGSRVRGAAPNRFAALSGFDFRNYWLA